MLCPVSPCAATSWSRLKFRGIARRDLDTDTHLAAAGWPAVRIWEHEDPGEAAEAIDQLVRDRTAGPDACRRTGVSQWYLNSHTCDQGIHSGS